MVDFNDTSKPVGEACREDGTLKDASEMEWIYSPSHEMRGMKRKSRDGSEFDSEIEELPSLKVSIVSFKHAVNLTHPL
jgi:hypothetical protein